MFSFGFYWFYVHNVIQFHINQVCLWAQASLSSFHSYLQTHYQAQITLTRFIYLLKRPCTSYNTWISFPIWEYSWKGETCKLCIFYIHPSKCITMTLQVHWHCSLKHNQVKLAKEGANHWMLHRNMNLRSHHTERTNKLPQQWKGHLKTTRIKKYVDKVWVSKNTSSWEFAD